MDKIRGLGGGGGTSKIRVVYTHLKAATDNQNMNRPQNILTLCVLFLKRGCMVAPCLSP
jgi:hypothetical protein